MREMQFFTPQFLLSGQPNVSVETVKNFCAFYGLNAVSVVQELAEFRPVFQKLHTLVDDVMSLNLSEGRKHQGTNTQDNDDCTRTPESPGSSEEDDIDENQMTPSDKGKAEARQGFIKLLQTLQQLSGFPTPNVAYKILISLAITSCSAERAMSRVRIIKNRQRTSMLDDWFSALLVLA